jgi:hypothetical protein
VEGLLAAAHLILEADVPAQVIHRVRIAAEADMQPAGHRMAAAVDIVAAADTGKLKLNQPA